MTDEGHIPDAVGPVHCRLSSPRGPGAWTLATTGTKGEGSALLEQRDQVLVLAGQLLGLGLALDRAAQRRARGLRAPGAGLELGDVDLQAGAVGVDREALVDDRPRTLGIAVDVGVGLEEPLPRRRGERGGAAEAEHGRAGLGRDRM